MKEKVEKEHRINLGMGVEAYNFDVVEEWGRVVELAKDCSVIFNMVDVGEYFDACAQSLAMVYQIPLIMGGSFC